MPPSTMRRRRAAERLRSRRVSRPAAGSSMQHEPGPAGQRAGDADQLALTVRELARASGAGEVAEVEHVERPVDRAPSPRAGAGGTRSAEEARDALAGRRRPAGSRRR